MTTTNISTKTKSGHFMQNLKSEADSARKGQITSKKLLPPGVFQEKLGISKQAISKAVKESRMFVVIGPSGENFYPAFFSEEKYDRCNWLRRALGAVVQALEPPAFDFATISLPLVRIHPSKLLRVSRLPKKEFAEICVICGQKDFE